MEYKNKYRLLDEYVIIYLDRRDGSRMECKVDFEDFTKIINFKYKWCAKYNKHSKSYYVCATIYTPLGETPEYKSNPLMMHRFIFDLDVNNVSSDYVDHIDHDTTNNRRTNLRVTTAGNNSKHRSGKNSNNTSGYRNVSWNKRHGRWMVQLQIEGKNTCLGRFQDIYEAGRFAEEMRKKYYGKFEGKE